MDSASVSLDYEGMNANISHNPAAEQIDANPDVSWGKHGIDAALWSDAEPFEMLGTSSIAPTRPALAGLSSGDETWLGHA